MTDDAHDLEAARAAADEGRLFDWISDFLASPGSDNADLVDKLAAKDLHWIGPVRLRFDELHRLAGPEDAPTLGEFDDDGLETAERMAESLEDGWEPPPLVVSWSAEHDHLVVEDGNHRVEGLRRAGRDRHWAVVGFADPADRDRFIERADELD